MSTVIVIGNGFDIDLGWRTSYRDFYECKKGWEMFKTDEDDLFQYIIKHVAENWFDFERTLHEYCVKKSKEDVPEDIISKDLNTYKSLKSELGFFIRERSKEAVNKHSFAYRLLEKYVEVCRYRLSSDSVPLLFSFNYTALDDVAKQIDPKWKFSYNPLHGTLTGNNIIFGFHDDMNIRKEYRDLQKSSDNTYNPAEFVTPLMDSNNIIFFGVSMGFIDSVYFEEMFKRVSVVGGFRERMHKKITFITKNEQTKREIKNNLQDIGIGIQMLSVTNSVNYILTSGGDKIEQKNNFLNLLNTI